MVEGAKRGGRWVRALKILAGIVVAALFFAGPTSGVGSLLPYALVAIFVVLLIAGMGAAWKLLRGPASDPGGGRRGR